MIVTMDDLDDRAQENAERRFRLAQDCYMAQVGAWWCREDEDEEDAEVRRDEAFREGRRRVEARQGR